MRKLLGRRSSQVFLAALVLLSLVPEEASAWWNASWKLRRKIYFRSSTLAEDLTGFPVLVRLDAARVDYGRTQNLGQDIRFVDADDTTQLPHEIEVWNEVGSSYAWVRVPQVNGGTNADYVWMYYDHPAAADGQSVSAVWTSYSMVQHLRETSGQHIDSAGNFNDSYEVMVGTQGSPTGQIHRADVLVAAGSHHVYVGDDATLNAASGQSLTVEAWVQSSSASNFMVAVSKEEDNQSEYQLWVDTGNAAFWVNQDTNGALPGDNPARVTSATNVRNGAWHYLVGRWNGASKTADLFVNGLPAGTPVTNGAIDAISTANPLVIGEEGDLNGGGNFDGSLDELRVSKVVRSADWIRGQHLSMTDAFLDFGPVQAFGCCEALAIGEVPGTSVSVTAPGSFQMLFTTAAGGSLEQLYDLTADPGMTRDLAGSLTSSTSARGLHNFGLQVGAGNFFNSGANDTGARLEVLEATPARVRLRQDAFYERGATSALLAGVKGIGDYSLYPTGKLGLHWERRVTAAAGIAYVSEYTELMIHRLLSGPLFGWVPYHEGGTAFTGSGQSAFLLARNESAGPPDVRTDILEVLYRDWTVANGYVASANLTGVSTDAPSELMNLYWNQPAGPVLPQGRKDTWDSLTYIKPTTFADHADTAVTSRRDDYRAPDDLAAPAAPTAGSGWFDTSELTLGPSDFFNEAEAAYALTLDPASGLAFDIDGSFALPRHTPFFKIRQWRSTAPYPVVSLEGIPLVSGVDYRAAVKPVARAHFSEESWYSTFESAAATATPAVGTTASVSGSIGFVPGRYGNGAQIDSNGDTITFPAASNFYEFFGAVELWYRPSYTCRTAPGCDSVRHVLWHMQQVGTAYFILEKTAGDALEFTVRNGATTTTKRVALGDFGWGADDWVHLRVTWDETSPIPADKLLVYVNGARPTQSVIGGPFTAVGLTVGPSYIGTDSSGAGHAAGVLDEFRVYTAESLPTALAHGGMTSSADEFLADATDNADLVELPVDADERGQYLYFGSDSKFRGLNVMLNVAGAGVASDAIDWQYWDGASWADLEAGCPGACSFGFVDQTASFTRNGTVYWTSDPTGWAPYSVNGGPDLYYLRAHLDELSPAYGTRPREGRVTTDILLFQYCGEITAAAQTFAFSPPVPTAVRLQSFSATGADSAVNLEWRTASELDNLGFDVYRSPSQEGPWSCLTPSLIPGLGSSAVGQAYSFRDGGLANGTRYFYRLDDVDAASKATSHGPVSAVPSAAAAADASGSPGSSRDKGKGTTASSCPDWVLVAYASSAGADAAAAKLRCTRHGDPEAVSLATLARDKHSVTLELRTGGFYALHTQPSAGEPSGRVRVYVPGFDFPQDAEAAALPIRRALTDAVVGRRVQLGGVRALDLVSFRGLVPSALGIAEMQVGRDGTVRAARRAAARAPRLFPKSELVRLLPSLFQGETKSAALEIAPLRFDPQRQQLVLAKRVRVRLLFTGREAGENGRGSLGRAPGSRNPVVSGETLARLYTKHLGLHAVAFEQLFPGQRRGVAASRLRLERQGGPVAFHLEPATAAFGPGSWLFFYADATAASTDFSADVAYELVRSGGGVVMPVRSAAPGSNVLASASFVSRSFETDRFYQPGLLDAADPWLWEALSSGATRVKSLSLSGISGSSGSAELEVFLQGASESGHPIDHHLSLSLNGTFVGEARFVGKTPYRVSLSLPASLLREGINDLSLTNVADTGVSSLVFLDRVSLAHPRTSALENGLFEGTWAEGGTASLTNAPADVAVLELGTDAAPRWLTGYDVSGGSVRFRAEAGRRYWVGLRSALFSPRVATVQPSALKNAGNQADYLLIGPKAFLDAAEPLVARRLDQGLAARAVAFEEIASEFGHGQASPEAIRGFLAYAFHSWKRPSPRYVVLLGDASYDPRNFIGTSQPSPLPALWTKTSYLWTASDPLLAAVNGTDNLPDLAIGRLPATTVAQAEALVAKLLAWEDSGQGLAGAAALVADNPDLAGDFDADVDDIRASYLGGREAKLLKLSELGPSMRPAILDALNSGLSYLNYVGHGGAAVWASENVWNSWDAPSLQAQTQQPLLVTMNCLNGYFVAPSFESLSESLLKAEGRGAIASFSPSGLSLDGPAHQYHRALMAELTGGSHQRLGDAILAAQKTYAASGLMPELLGIYHLLGDPATKIR
jgi:hypothetical protein